MSVSIVARPSDRKLVLTLRSLDFPAFWEGKEIALTGDSNEQAIQFHYPRIEEADAKKAGGSIVPVARGPPGKR